MSSEVGQARSEPSTLAHLIDVLAEHGERQAILALHKEGAESWSYNELVDHARRLTLGLAKLGVGRGDDVVLLAPSRPEWIVACLAIVGTGAVTTPVDVQLGDEALARVLRLSGAKAI